MNRILIVDDEVLARGRIRRMLDTAGVQAETAEAANAAEAVESVMASSPDLVFLDIQMPGMSGFDFLSQFERRDFKVIFQTAYDQFALRAFDESAVDYLLKPFTQDRFEQALVKALQTTDLSADDRLHRSLQKQSVYLEKIAVKSGSKTKILNLCQVTCFKSEDLCTIAYSESGEFIIDLSLDHLIKRLDPSKFMRTHRSAIAAISHITAVGDSKNRLIWLSNGMKIPVARTLRSKVCEVFKVNGSSPSSRS